MAGNFRTKVEDRSRSRTRASPRSSSKTLDANEASSSRSRERSRTSSRSRTTPYPKDEPIVTHGWTASRPCGFREVCQAIKESAFVTNNLPIIISLEVHADQEQQETMVAIMKEEWGDLLLDRALDSCDPKFHAPKLGDLCNKILIKVKKAGAGVTKTSVVSSQPSPSSLAAPAPSVDDSASEDDRSIRCYRAAPSSPLALATQSSAASSQNPRQKRVPICPSLASLGVYTYSQHFEHLRDKFWKKPGHIFSIMESNILDMFEEDPGEIFQHNKNHFMRAFPDHSRINSSNPDPAPFWRAGVQMVAMNWQRPDEGMMFHDAMFADEQGWVLKPEGYRAKDAAETHLDAIMPKRTLDLKITVLAGQHVFVAGGFEEGGGGQNARSAGSLKPTVRCDMHFESAGGLSSPSEYKRKTTCGQTDHPDFGEGGRTLSFEGIRDIVESLSFIR